MLENLGKFSASGCRFEETFYWTTASSIASSWLASWLASWLV
jgi:hypothetical protein